MNKRVTKAIFSAIDEVNQQLPKEKKLEKSNNTVLIGQSTKLDSLGQVNLIVAIEEKIEENFDTAITLTDELAMSHENSQFHTIGSLCEYITKHLETKFNSYANN